MTSAPSSPSPAVTLNSGARMPQLGFGVYQLAADEATEAVSTALRAGFRSIDTATAYRNEAAVGRAIAESGIPREELFVTTKLWNTHQGYDSTLRAFDSSLSELGLDHVDLCLIHWPMPGRDLYAQTWKAFEKLHADGLVRSIGVSNFHIAHLRRLFDEPGVVPAVNQIELHPRLQQYGLRAFHAEHGIATEAWSPLGRAQGLLDSPAITEPAARHGRSPAQIVLRWHLQLGNITIPRSRTPSRIQENIDVFDFELSGDDMEALAGLELGARIGPDPDVLGA
ncbi:aldo/keto reductase [Saccharopolyspora erythraea]|uniref:aldo/keto reductase n=1 Tax=Saccharopolyspora erythraea TaxID=1836 RepID=UPI001BAAFBD6|nr:aldo/keto reductase [Saccharopolyspora erythraea]QUH03730.1 aldo/keto reductase [Saccharopolyspora erythraea]